MNWEESAESIALKIRTSDSQPGAVAKFLINDGTLVSTDEYRVFGVHTEEGQLLRYVLGLIKIAILKIDLLTAKFVLIVHIFKITFK